MNSASFTDYKTEQARILKENGASDSEIDQIVGKSDGKQADD